MKLSGSAFALALLATTTLWAGPPKSEDHSKPPRWTFNITPIGESKPALRWHLLPELRERHPGNAAAGYLRAMSSELMHHFQNEKLAEEIHASNDWPIADLLTDKAKGLRTLAAASALKEAEYAARYDFCDWNLHQRQREEGIRLLLPELQSMRTLSRGLTVRTRMRIAEGDFPAAIRSLQTQFAAARHVGRDSSNLIQMLIGSAIAGQALHETAHWIEAPNSPNLYWGLTALPSPFISACSGMEGERIFIDVLLPGFRDALMSKSPPPPLDMEKTKALLEAIGLDSNPVAVPFLLAAHAESAGKYLIADGWKPEVVKSMPVTTTVFLHGIAAYDEFLDESLKWMTLPPMEALPALAAAESKFAKHTHSSESTMLAKVLLPTVHSVYYIQLRFDRQIAGLRCVEAIRLHAAATGKLPTSRTEIKLVPWPTDPMTGKPFEITVDGDSVKIVATSSPPRVMDRSGFQFVVTLAKR